jgi:hypothetical protein
MQITTGKKSKNLKTFFYFLGGLFPVHEKSKHEGVACSHKVKKLSTNFEKVKEAINSDNTIKFG